MIYEGKRYGTKWTYEIRGPSPPDYPCWQLTIWHAGECMRIYVDGGWHSRQEVYDFLCRQWPELDATTPGGTPISRNIAGSG